MVPQPSDLPLGGRGVSGHGVGWFFKGRQVIPAWADSARGENHWCVIIPETT